MISNLIWDDWLDKDRISQTGEFHVHRNYKGSDGKYKFSPYKGAEDRSANNIYIGNTLPIATGITAFYVCDYYSPGCLKNHLKNHWIYDIIVDFYDKYFKYCRQPELIKNKKLPNPDTDENVEKRFIPFHIKEERLKLEESKKYFEECKDSDDEKLNCDIRRFVNGYFQWLDSQGATPEMTPNKKKIPIQQIALIYAYEGWIITRENGNDIAKKYGQISGEALYQAFSRYSLRKKRISIETSRQKTLNKIKRIEKIISFLSESAQKSAIDEVNTLKAALDKETF